MDNYPKWKYSTAASVVVEDAEAESALSGDWYDSPADVPSEEAKSEKDQLLAECAAKGITADKRMGVAKLRDLLAADMGADPQ